MDSNPGDLARALGPGRWLLRGVAGSGKTLALTERARLLRERHPAWRILVACFNGSLASELRRAVPARPGLEVATFHDWAQARLAAGGVAIPPPPGRGAEWDRYWTHDMARLLLRSFVDGRIPGGTYQAILVDEGQDFAADWYRALLLALDPATDSLLVALDPDQDIYARRVPWGDLGLATEARTRTLDVNRRNSRAISSAARRVLAGAPGANPPVETEGAAPGTADPTGAADDPRPEVCRWPSFDASREHALAWIRARAATPGASGDVLVLGVSRLDMITVNAWLNSKGIAAWLPAATDGGPGVRVSTIHGAKGLDAESVLLLDAHQLDTRDAGEARPLLYIAMTRARRDLCVSHFRDSPLMAELARACA